MLLDNNLKKNPKLSWIEEFIKGIQLGRLIGLAAR